MSKKVLSVILAAVLLVSMACIAGVSASAASAGGTVYVELPEQWAKSAKTVYCHMWANGGDDVYAWQTKNEKMTLVEGNKYSYEIAPGTDANMIIVSTNTGVQTYDLTFGDECMGDTIIIDPSTQIENAIDSEKTAARATWQNNSDKYGPHMAISSIGNVIGEKLAPGEDGEALLNAFKTNYSDLATPEKIAELRASLGLPAEGGNEQPASSEEPASNNDDTPSANSTGSTASTSSASGTSSGATTTGDETPYVVLGVILVAALGVIVLASRKRVTE